MTNTHSSSISKIDNGFTSDHAPKFLASHDLGNIMTWNILQKCEIFAFNSQITYNNAFNAIETTEEYHARIDIIIDYIHNIIDNDFNIICLQETPGKKDFGYFINKLSSLENYNISHSNNSTNIILYNNTRFKIIDECQKLEEQINANITDHKNRIEIVSLYDNTNDNILNILNLHLKGFIQNDLIMEKQRISETTEIWNNFTDYCSHESPESWIMTGDFNYNIQRGHFKDIIDEDINVITNISDEDLPGYYGIDGFIYLTAW